MSEPTPRRALPEQPKNRKPVIAGLAGLAALALVGGGVAIARHNSSSGSSSSASPSASVAGDGSATAPANGGCPAAATMLVDPAWSAATKQAATAWATSLGAGCTPLTITDAASADTAKGGLGSAQGWVPEDPTVLAGATDATLKGTKATPVGTSPLVLVNTPEAAKALGTPTTEQLRQLLTLEQTWANHGKPQWGWFKLVVPDPQTSVVGDLGFASLTTIASRGAKPATNLATATSDQLNMPRAEQRIVARPALADVTQQLGANPADANGRTPAGPRTGVTTQALALQAKDVKASWLDDHSGLSMSVANPGNDETVAKFTTWLGTAEGQQALAKAGVTTAKAAPDAAAVKALGLVGTAPKVTPATAAQIATARAMQGQFSKRTSALLVLDTSGSMGNPLGNSPVRRIDAVTGLLLKTWEAWPPGTASGMISFHSDAQQNPVVQTVVPLQLDTTKEWVASLPKFKSALSTVQVGGGTPLYQAIATAWDYNTKHYVAGHTNHIVVVTDGKDEDSRNATTLAQLLARLPKQPDPKRPIKVTYVALGPDADIATLRKIADATGQQALQVTSLADMQAKLPVVMAP